MMIVVVVVNHPNPNPPLQPTPSFPQPDTDQRWIDFSVSKIDLVTQGTKVNISIAIILQRFILC